MLVNHPHFCSIPWLSTQEPEDEYCVLTFQRFVQDFRSGFLRPVVKECSEPFACKPKWQRRTAISPSSRGDSVLMETPNLND